jgi:hypothetical protein
MTRAPKYVGLKGNVVEVVILQTGGGVPARKGQRLQECERAAEYVTTREREKGALRLAAHSGEGDHGFRRIATT